jgi:hypothetical protein
MNTAGRMSKQMLKHYSHIRMEAKRTALESILEKPTEAAAANQNGSPVRSDAQQVEGGSLQSGQMGGRRKDRKAGKSLKRFGSSGRIRTYNPSVNS